MQPLVPLVFHDNWYIPLHLEEMTFIQVTEQAKQPQLDSRVKQNTREKVRKCECLHFFSQPCCSFSLQHIKRILFMALPALIFFCGLFLKLAEIPQQQVNDVCHVSRHPPDCRSNSSALVFLAELLWVTLGAHARGLL